MCVCVCVCVCVYIDLQFANKQAFFIYKNEYKKGESELNLKRAMSTYALFVALLSVFAILLRGKF